MPKPPPTASEVCYYCQEPTDEYAGNPSRWPLHFPHQDEPGKVKAHHVACVLERLEATTTLRQEVKDLGEKLQGAYDTEFRLRQHNDLLTHAHARLREALRKYGRHFPRCLAPYCADLFHPNSCTCKPCGRCTCGLTAALTEGTDG